VYLTRLACRSRGRRTSPTLSVLRHRSLRSARRRHPEPAVGEDAFGQAVDEAVRAGCVKDTAAAKALLTGTFRDSYTSLTKDVVIPGAKQKQISAAASVPAAASVSAGPHHAVVLVFINQRVTVGTGAPTDTASAVRMTLDKISDRWLISDFQPV
jgi:hypothetical protein